MITVTLGLTAGALWGVLCYLRDWEWRGVLSGALLIAIVVALASHSGG